MADVFTAEKRSWVMSRIRDRDTKPERVVRSVVHRMGYRFRLRRRDLPGKPDIVLPKHRSVILVHGCFWHGHAGCTKAKRPETKRDFWNSKLDGNIERDRAAIAALQRQGWRVLVVWECQTKDTERLASVLAGFLSSEG